MATPATSRVVTLGCRLNAYESEAMRTLAGPGRVVVNTCAVTAEAERQARQAIRKAARENPDHEIVATGCAAQIAPERFAAMPEVDRVLGNREKLDPASWAPGAPAHEVGDIFAETRAAAPLVDGLAERARAHVQIQNGCDHRCTFCVIPQGRGNSRSVPPEAVIAQTHRLVARGFKEIVLTGVDITSYGGDLAARPSLGRLCGEILKAVPELPRLRLSSIDAVEIDDELMALLGGEERLQPHLHLSLQAGANMILKRMKRRHSREDAIGFCARARAARPDIAFGADLIAGFPTETEPMFEESLRLIEECGLAFLHVFPFSPRPGTPAARMPGLDRATIKARAAALRAAGEAAIGRHLASRLGASLSVLMETERRGRAGDFTLVETATPEAPGDILSLTPRAAAGDRLLV